MQKRAIKYSEQQLLQGIRKRDNRVLDFITREYYLTIRHLVHKMGGNDLETQDIFQDALVGLMVLAEDPEYIPASSIKTLMYAISKNLWSKKLRYVKREEYFDLAEHDTLLEPDFVEYPDLDLYQKLFWEVYKMLPRNCRVLLDLYFRDQSNNEIARLLNLSPRYVRKQKSVCTQKLMDGITRNREYGRLMSTGFGNKPKQN